MDGGKRKNISAGPSKRRHRPEEINPSVRIVLDALRKSTSLSAGAESETNYRNKMTYSIIEGNVVTSNLGEKRVNDVIEHWAALIRSNTNKHELSYYREIGVKLSRKGTALLKLILRISEDQLNDFIKLNINPILEELSTYCSIDCAFLQHSNGRSKPNKSDDYVLVLGTHLIEHTPQPFNDPYIISPDTFAEVNHDAEDRLWKFLVSYLKNVFKNDISLDLLLMGRDTNASFVSLYPYFPFVDCYCMSHCPKVAADMKHNTDYVIAQKEKKTGISKPKIDITYVEGKFQYSTTMSTFGTDRDKLCLVNAGRGGMADDTVHTVINNKQINNIIYVSCNQQTAYQDVDIIISRGGFYVEVCPFLCYLYFSKLIKKKKKKKKKLNQNYCCFNFQAGTEYVMQVFCMRRSGCGIHRVLVQPVGPPGSGKSSLSHRLSEVFSTVKHIERDVVYKNKRDAGLSMKSSKRDTHSDIATQLSTCDTDICVYDSTSGAAEGRQYINDNFFTPSNISTSALSITVYFTSTDVSWLLNNCMSRIDHPGFPDTAEGGTQKISNVLLSIETPSSSQPLPQSVSGVLVRVSPKTILVKEVLTRVASLLLIAPRLAQQINLSAEGIELEWTLSSEPAAVVSS